MIHKRAIVLFLVLILAVPALLAQMQGAGRRGKAARNYDPSTEITVKGTVQDVVHPTGKTNNAGTHLTLKSDQGTFDIHVGPSAYISSQQFTFTKGDEIEVVGSKTTVDGKEALRARQITKDGKVLTLRDKQGLPLWSRAGAARK